MNVPRPVAFRLVQMFDVGAWIKVYRETLHEHVHPHCFKFVKKDSKVVMFYRKWSKEEWMGPVDILKVIEKHRLRGKLFGLCMHGYNFNCMTNMYTSFYARMKSPMVSQV